MTSIDRRAAYSQPDNLLLRREFLGRLAATGVTVVLLPGVANATTEIWEEGDPLCAVPDPPLEKPNGYDLDRLYLDSFVGLSEALTGVVPLDRHLSNQYMERYATNRQLTTNLDLMIQAYRKIPGTPRPSEADVKQQILLSQDPKIRAAAQQIIYIWYISAFYLPVPDSNLGAPLPPPLEDNPSDTRKRVWMYGTPEQYGRGLLWSVIRAHAPMTSGGAPGHWALSPTI
jgi:hypothetical protein